MFVFLFTDLEASTRLWESHPDSMGPALAHHDEILRSAVESNGGSVVKTTGDGLMAVFDGVGACVSACLDAQHRLAGAVWEVPEPLRVRMGVHLGDAEPRAGDFYGTAVNRAARIMAAAHGGQVLVSTAAAHLVSLALPEGTGLRDLGSHRLKDLTAPEHLFQLTGPGLPDDFPALATLEATPNNLPVQVSEFLGRRRELDSLLGDLDTPEVRLLTLTGPGGTGKTRLALQAAADLTGSYPDGVFFVDLAAEREPDAAFEAVVRDLGFAGAKEGSPLQVLKAKLRDGRRLIVLDNLEQVTAAGPGIVDLLGFCPELKMMVTSREALRVRGERLFPVPALGLADPSAGSERVAESEAAMLFVERARSIQPDFALTDDNAGAVAEITRHLDGLPLAIELAAARLGVFTVGELATRLRDRVDVLGRGARDLPDRQRTLRSTIEWSYGLLDREECLLFELLSVFSSARLEAIEAVADAAGTDIDVIDTLASLVSKSLVVAVETDGSRRFSMLRTIGEYAAERLALTPDAESAVRRAHAEHYADHVARLAPRLEGAEREDTLAELMADIGNLRSAWRFWVGESGLARLYQLLDGLWALTDSRGWYHAAVALTTDLLEVLATAAPSSERDAEELSLRTGLARSLMAVKGFGPEVEEQFRRALELSDVGDAATGRAQVLRSLASYYMNAADMPAALATGRELLALGERQQDRAAMVEGHVVIGATTFFVTEIQEAVDHLDRAIALSNEVTAGTGRLRLGAYPQVIAHFASSVLMAQQGRPEQAVVRAGQGLQLARRLGNPFSVAYALYHFGYLQLGRRRYPETLRWATELASVAGENDYPVWRALSSVLAGVARCGLGEAEEGLALAVAGTELYQGLSTPPVFWAPLQAVRAHGFALAGRLDEALAMIDEAIALVGIEPVYPEFRTLRGDILAALPDRDPAEVVESYRTAIRGARAIGARITELGARSRLLAYAAPERMDGDVAELLELYQGFTEGFDEHELVEARAVLGLE